MSDDIQTLVDRLPRLGEAVVVTLELTIGGALLAVVVAFLLGFGSRTRTLWVRGPSRVVVEFFRGTSLVVQLFWIFYVLPVFGYEMEALAVGIVALGLNYGAYGAEVVRGSIESVPKGQWEACTALNMSWFHRVRRVIRLFGMVNCTPDFPDMPAVVDGASDLMLELFGPEYGCHARSAVGQVNLPRGQPVEINGEFEVKA